LIAVDVVNIASLMKTLRAFGSPTVDSELFKETGTVFRMGRSPIKIEVINDASGIVFDDCYTRRIVARVDELEISLISFDDLLANKKAAGRPRDLADVETLERFKKR
jgi:hypothetical protein